MATLHELETGQINEFLNAAVQQNVPLTVSLQTAGSWRNLRSRFLAIRDGHLLIEMPTDRDDQSGPQLSPADKLGVTFKLKHHKHLFTCTVAGVEQLACDDGPPADVLSLCFPMRMQRLQRRAFVRVDVPPGRIVRAAFWLGGRDAEPAGTSPEYPVWSGHVTNISAGGFQLECAADPTDVIEVGEIVGVRICFVATEEAIYSDAQFRHVELAGDRAIIGFQFIGLTQSDEGRETLKRISARVAEFQHLSACPNRERRRA